MRVGMKKRIAALVATVALVFCLPVCAPLTAFAASAFDQGGAASSAAGVESETEYNAGNMFAIMHPVSSSDIENDLYWAGQTLDATKVNVGTSGHGSIIAAGQNITLKNVTVADSVRAAAQTIVIEHATIQNNITAAAQSISLGNEVKANGVYAWAETVTVDGTYQGGSLAGQTVNFNGTVEGDLSIEAAQIEIGSNAQVKGQLVMPEGVQINIADGAQVPNITYTPAPPSTEPTFFDNLLSVVYAIMAHIVLVGLFFLIIRKPLVNAANMARKQLGMMLLAGLVVFLVTPLVCLLLIFPLITIPVVVLIGLVMLIIALFSIPFAGSALGMAIFKDRMNPVVAAILGTVILTILAYIPIISVITVIFCIVFTAGYLWMSYWDIHQKRKQEKIAAQQAAYMPSPMNGVPGAPTGSPVEVPPAPTGEAAPNVPPAPPAPPVETPAPDTTEEPQSNDSQK